MAERALATIETIRDITPIPKADRIVAATVRGWKTVVGKTEFVPGDRCVYLEIDSFLPIDLPLYASYAERGTKTLVDGSVGHVLKTIRLRGQLSQGLAIPVPHTLAHLPDGADVTELMGVRLWEPPAPTGAGIIGQRPGHVESSSAVRVQNVDTADLPGTGWSCTEKLDGQSLWVSYDPDTETFRAGSRNTEIDIGSMSADSVVKRAASKLFVPMADLAAAVEQSAGHSVTVVFQAEMVGPKIQGNPYRLDELQVFTYRQQINGVDFPCIQRGDGMRVVPEHRAGERTPIGLEAVNGLTSQINPQVMAEGLVWRYHGDAHVQDRCIKAISDDYLLNEPS